MRQTKVTSRQKKETSALLESARKHLPLIAPEDLNTQYQSPFKRMQSSSSSSRIYEE